MNVYQRTVRLGDKDVLLEVGRFSEQADAAVLASCGGTVVHATVAVGGESNLGYFPLQVEYVEKFFAGGRIKGSRWVKREGRPTDDAILSARVIDRTIRPMFPEGFKREVQVIVTVLSVDLVNNPDTLGLLAACAALEIASVPFDGPVAGLRIGYNAETENFIFNPTYEEAKSSNLDLILSGSSDAIVMVEANGNEVSEELMLKAFAAGQEVIASVCNDFTAMRGEIGKERMEYVASEFDADKMAEFKKRFATEIDAAVKARADLKKDDGLKAIAKTLIEEDEANALLPLGDMLNYLVKKAARRGSFENGIRPDGRKLDEIRKIECEIDVLPMTHGSAVFKRGATQVLSVTTLGSPEMAQTIDDMEGEEQRYYIHHYNMPPYASGETGRVGSPKRREVGHGALAERALIPVLPSHEDFPYTIHVVSEVMSSNGSTSQASVCGSTLSLMAAGVPIRKPVAGIAMGLMKEGDQHVILSDIQGLEDFTGDMDFKVAGTADGITAIQMDIKIKGISFEILTEALERARVGRLHILGKMLETISEPRKTVAKHAPKIGSTVIPADRIGELIGPGGKNIRALQEETGTEVGIEEDGTVHVTAVDQAAIDAAIKRINDMMMVFEAGMEFDGEVVRVEDYGVFVELVPGRSGLAHVSMISTEYVRDANELYKVGDQVHARIVEVDGDRIRLTLLTPEQEEEQRAKRAERGGDRGGDDRGGRSFGGGRDGGRGRGGRDDRGGRGGDRRGGGRFGDRRGRDDRGGRSFGGGRDDRSAGRGPREDRPAEARSESYTQPDDFSAGEDRSNDEPRF